MGAIAVFVGGGLGALLRYGAVLAIGGPMATLAVNVIGSFAIGILAARLPIDPPLARWFFMTGLLGGFTTFSAFSIDTVTLAQRGQVAIAIGYAAASILLSLAAAAAGLALARP